ncbi:MAG: hypothetical protein HKL96_05335 [Phycisphaerales bacterium]|nr:hypothetical protein [Phycisphaerales bacterium]
MIDKVDKVKPSVMKFLLTCTEKPIDVFSRFHPQGRSVLNRTEWRGKEPRSCAVSSVKSRPSEFGHERPVIFEVEVSYRPKGTITYVGDTKYDGWTAMMLDRNSAGKLLDGHGMALATGQPPVYLPFELYADAEFNEIDFGEFIGESETNEIRHCRFEEVLRDLEVSGRFSASIESSFVAQRRHRPTVKVILSNAPSGTGADRVGTRIVIVNNLTPHLQQVLVDQLIDAVSGFIEGRYSLKNLSNDEIVFLDVSDILVDCTPNEEGKDSRFNILGEYTPEGFLEDLAARLVGIYDITVSVVDGPTSGLLLRRKPLRELGFND